MGGWGAWGAAGGGWGWGGWVGGRVPSEKSGGAQTQKVVRSLPPTRVRRGCWGAWCPGGASAQAWLRVWRGARREVHPSDRFYPRSRLNPPLPPPPPHNCRYQVVMAPWRPWYLDCGGWAMRCRCRCRRLCRHSPSACPAPGAFVCCHRQHYQASQSQRAATRRAAAGLQACKPRTRAKATTGAPPSTPGKTSIRTTLWPTAVSMAPPATQACCWEVRGRRQAGGQAGRLLDGPGSRFHAGSASAHVYATTHTSTHRPHAGEATRAGKHMHPPSFTCLPRRHAPASPAPRTHPLRPVGPHPPAMRRRSGNVERALAPLGTGLRGVAARRRAGGTAVEPR